MTKTSDRRPASSAADAHLPASLATVRAWQPQEFGASGYQGHLHLLAWLVFTLRPAQVVGLGVGTGVAYFALCQAAAEAGLAAQFFGVDTWAEAGGAIPDPVRDVNATRYGGFSRLIRAEARAAVELFDLGGVDLLLVDLPPSADLLQALHDQWLGLMSPGGVIVLRGVTDVSPDGETGAALRALLQDRAHVEVDGVLLVLAGSAPHRTLSMAAALPRDHPERAAFQSHLSQIAAPLRDRIAVTETEARLATLTRDLDESRRQHQAAVAALTARLRGAEAERDVLAAQLDTAQRDAIAEIAARDAALAEQARRTEEIEQQCTLRVAAEATFRHELVVLTRLAEERSAALATAEAALTRQAADAATGAAAHQSALLHADATQARLLAAIEAARTEAVAELAGRDAALSASARQIEALARERDATAAALAIARGEVVALTRAAQEVHATLDQSARAHDAAVAAHDAEALRLSHAIHDLHTRLAEQGRAHEAALGLLRATVAQRDADILALRTSTSWKVTAPLRRAKQAFTPD